MSLFSTAARFRAFLLLLIIFALSTAVQAQKLQQSPVNDPAVQWKTPAQAQTALLAELQVLQPQLVDLPPGSGPHTDLLRRILYYKTILRNLLNGTTVQKSLEAALPDAASLGGVYEQNYTPESTLRALYNDALGLVAN